MGWGADSESQAPERWAALSLLPGSCVALAVRPGAHSPLPSVTCTLGRTSAREKRGRAWHAGRAAPVPMHVFQPLYLCSELHADV